MKTERELLEDVVGLFRGGYSPTSIAGELIAEIEAALAAPKWYTLLWHNDDNDAQLYCYEAASAEAAIWMFTKERIVDELGVPEIEMVFTEELDAFEDAPADIARRHADAALRAIAEAEGQVLPAQRMEDQPCRDTIVTLLAALRHVCDERGFAYGYLDAEGQHLYLSDKRWPL